MKKPLSQWTDQDRADFHKWCEARKDLKSYNIYELLDGEWQYRFCVRSKSEQMAVNSVCWHRQRNGKSHDRSKFKAEEIQP